MQSYRKLENNFAYSCICPITNGFEKPVQILQATATASEILKIATFACVEAIK